MSTITFIGNAKATEDEIDALDFLGRILGHQGIELKTTARGDANNAVIAGYRAKDLEPTLIESDLLNATTDQMIVYADSKLLATLDKAKPDWMQENLIHLAHKQQLFDFIDLLLTKIHEQTGETVEPF